MIILLSVILLNVSAQVTEIDPEDAAYEENDDEDSDPSWTDKIVLGGNLGAQFGTFTAVDISPLIGYKVTDKLTPGVGFTYQYVSYKYPYEDPFNYYIDYKSSIVGGRIFTQYDIFYGLFAHAEYENLWIKVQPEEPYLPYKAQEPGFFLGGGYNLEVGGKAYLQLMALYNLLWSADNLVYASPFQIRIGIKLGL